MSRPAGPCRQLHGIGERQVDIKIVDTFRLSVGWSTAILLESVDAAPLNSKASVELKPVYIINRWPQLQDAKSQRLGPTTLRPWLQHLPCVFGGNSSLKISAGLVGIWSGTRCTAFSHRAAPSDLIGRHSWCECFHADGRLIESGVESALQRGLVVGRWKTVDRGDRGSKWTSDTDTLFSDKTSCTLSPVRMSMFFACGDRQVLSLLKFLLSSSGDLEIMAFIEVQHEQAQAGIRTTHEVIG